MGLVRGGVGGDGAGEGGQCREADRAADLAGRVHQSAGQTRVLRREAFHGECGELDEGDAQAEADEDARAQDIGEVAPVGGDP